MEQGKSDFLVVLTGAGVSAESKVPTFRSNGGLWQNHRFEDLATPSAFARDPKLVWDFYRWRQDGVKNAKPNRAHEILVEIEAAHKDNFLLVTQNVDNLHEQAGSKNLLHLHGEIMKGRCLSCGATWGPIDYHNIDVPCPNCQTSKAWRPHIVWFGETPFFMEEIQAALKRATLFMAIGTSGVVYPAAQFVHVAKGFGAKTILVNLDAADNIGVFDQVHRGNASECLEKIWSDAKGNLFQN
ncbi:MAG: NAD-dependent deacylase [Bacteriovoracaceae bacterium]|nr:NAD-dependent deacylase [Bacteriovoracaceae bacterium]